MLAPQIGCSTFGSWDFIRVPAPAARMTTAAGRLTVTWRCSLIGCCVTGRPRPGLGYNRSRGADETVHTPTLAEYRPAVRWVAATPRHDPHHITVCNHGGGPRQRRGLGN